MGGWTRAPAAAAAAAGLHVVIAALTKWEGSQTIPRRTTTHRENEVRPVQVQHHEQQQQAVEQRVVRLHRNAMDGRVLQGLGQGAARWV